MVVAVDEPDAEVYAARYVEDGMGDGFRVYTSHDDVYEARQVDGAEVRVYPEDTGWWMKVRCPVEEDDAYDLIQETFDAIAEETGTRPSLTIGEFHEGVERGHVSREADGYTVHYRGEHDYDLDIPTSRIATVAGSTAGVGAWTVGGGAAVGAGLGALGAAVGLLAGGPPGAIGFGSFMAAVGGGAGGLAGGVTGVLDVKDGVVQRRSYDSLSRGLVERFNRPFRKRRERKRVSRGVENSLLDRVNDKRALDAYMASEGVDYDPERAERHSELEDAGLEEALEEVWTIQFTDFEKGEGVSVTKRYDTYEEAVGAVERHVDADAAVGRPSIYRDAEALDTVLDALPEEDVRVVVGNALEQDTSETVDDLLDSEYDSLVAEVGPEWSLEHP